MAGAIARMDCSIGRIRGFMKKWRLGIILFIFWGNTSSVHQRGGLSNEIIEKQPYGEKLQRFRSPSPSKLKDPLPPCVDKETVDVWRGAGCLACAYMGIVCVILGG